MSNGYGPASGTLTFGGLGWRPLNELELAAHRKQKEKEKAMGASDAFFLDADESRIRKECDVILRVKATGWGAYAGVTVEHPVDGNDVEIPMPDGGFVVGKFVYDDDYYAGVSDLGIPKEQDLVFHFEDVRRTVLTSRAERLEQAEREVEEAERKAEAARARLTALRDTVPAT